MSERESERFGLAELAEKAGVSPRTARFYIARGLLPGPDRRGRAASYGAEHLRRITEIRRLQEQGLTLAEIARQGSRGGLSPAAALPAESWRHYRIAPDVTVQVRESPSPWRARRIQRALAQLQQSLGNEAPEGAGEKKP